MTRIFSFTLFLFLFLACINDQETPTPVTDLTLTEKSAEIIAADNQFGFELFQKVNASTDGSTNTMISPMSVSLALAMLYNGTEGNTKTQIEDMLHKENFTTDDINQSYKELVTALVSHDPKVELSISNAIFYRNTFSVKNDFITTNQNYYNAKVSGLDFSKTTETLNTVNGWVNNNTKGKIDKILEKVNPEDVMYLLNAIYFNGEWQYRFDTKDTKNQPFTKEDGQIIQAPTMTIENKFKIYRNQTFQMLEMPYGSGKYSMLFFLPASGKTTGDVILSLNSDNVNDWVSKMTEQNKKIYLPKFEFKFDQSLVDVLKALGMTDAFNSSANLSGIADGGNLEVSEVMHKTYIKMDERGTEAAAVTEITIVDTSAEPDNSFRVDHPFVFAIREKDTNAILFIGKVMDPKED
jgi:serpin B